jgi:ketosteroid isomerase-like protein
MSPTELVKRYYSAFDTHDFSEARSLMRDDFRFVGPLMEANSPEELFTQMRAFDCDFKNRSMQIVEHGDTVAALFDCVFTRPFQATIRMSEWFTVRDGKIASSNLIYDTKQMPTPSSA